MGILTLCGLVRMYYTPNSLTLLATAIAGIALLMALWKEKKR